MALLTMQRRARIVIPVSGTAPRRTESIMQISKFDIEDAMHELDARPVSLTYAGKDGCACGCIGTYSDKLVTLTKRRNKLIALLDNGAATSLDVRPGMYVSVTHGNGRVITLYTDGRGL